MKFRKSISFYTALIMLMSMFSQLGMVASAAEEHIVFAMKLSDGITVGEGDASETRHALRRYSDRVRKSV